MPKFVEEIMRRKLPMLITLFVVIAAAEGVYLCRTQPKTNINSYGRKEHFSVVRSSDALGDEFPHARSDDYGDDNDGSYRKESSRDKILRAMLINDSETKDDGKYRAESLQNDYSILEGSPRAYLVRGETPGKKDYKTPSETDKEKQQFTVHDYLLNRFTRNEGTRGEVSGWGKRQLEDSNYARFNYHQNGEYSDDQFN